MLRDTLKTLLAAYGPSGNEHTVAETVKGLIASHVDSMRVDAMGNLIVEKLGTDENGKRITACAHLWATSGEEKHEALSATTRTARSSNWISASC